MLGNSDWKQRHAALYTITCMAEGSLALMRLELQNILSLIQPHFMDPHPRVRYAAAHCIGQLCTDFAVSFSSFFHSISLSNKSQ